ncbi:MAG: carbamoyltransferase HypF [Anaerolineae bacterium]|nr:carbamoyltransferase HypF [Anaerolineae bacterium]
MNGMRVRVVIGGAVQGVGFRPFIYRLATSLGLTGWVGNSSQGVEIEAEGSPRSLEAFLARIEAEKPPRALIQHMDYGWLEPVGNTTFEIHHSDSSGDKTALVLPDMAICPDCLRDITDPANRRYQYPFTNCTNCGPRFSIIEALPYDRPNTTMRLFEMCDECRAEYENPLDRRFHAQPNACPTCGPQLALWDAGNVTAQRHEALLRTAEAIRKGAIVAIKGLGGFHLMVDARNQDAVMRLRDRKRREEKPFALMFPSLALIQAYCAVSDLEEQLLTSAEAPIVLLRTSPQPLSVSSLAGKGLKPLVMQNSYTLTGGEVNPLGPAVAPGNPYLGVMLPYTPLHHLLMAELGFPVVATSGNLSDEPICIDEYEALERLNGIADVFLVHNRPITRHVDDSVMRVMADRPLVLRRARGYAPLPIHVEKPLPNLLATGAHLKNTIAIAAGQDIFISQHIGDLETQQAFEASQQAAISLSSLYEHHPVAVACDLHPNYLSTQAAEMSGLPVVRVQHHYAHVLACMAENGIDAPILGVSWDGTGYGLDGTIWGGEFLRVDSTSFERAAHLRTFRLPGGDRAVKEPRRIALGLLYELDGDDVFTMDTLAPVRAFSDQERIVLRKMLYDGINSPVTSSAGRLFDAVAALLDMRQIANFEGQAAMLLEFATVEGVADCYPFEIQETAHGAVIDWAATVTDILNDLQHRIPAGQIAARFHNTMTEMIIAVARRIGLERVVLTGGCFQNKYLTEHTIHRLRAEGFTPYWHQHIPTNDGSIAVGQIIAAARAFTSPPNPLSASSEGDNKGLKPLALTSSQRSGVRAKTGVKVAR